MGGSMAQPIEFWTFLAANLVVIAFGGVLTSLSLVEYLEDGRDAALGASTAGFGAITVGALVAAVYELGGSGGYDLSGRGLVALHVAESILVALGLALLFYAIKRP